MPPTHPCHRPDPAPPFDPAGGLFLGQSQRPASLAAVGPGELSPLQRALLVIDGTVTTVLAAWALEPVAVETLSQAAAVLPAAEPWLDAPAGAPVLTRSVLLVGVHSQTLFAFAESVICTERLPAALRDGLLAGGFSLGQILLLPGFESRREGLWYGRERPATLPPAVAALTEADFLTRTYRVSAAARPLMLITERFPWGLRG